MRVNGKDLWVVGGGHDAYALKSDAYVFKPHCVTSCPGDGGWYQLNVTDAGGASPLEISAPDSEREKLAAEADHAYTFGRRRDWVHRQRKSGLHVRRRPQLVRGLCQRTRAAPR